VDEQGVPGQTRSVPVIILRCTCSRHVTLQRWAQGSWKKEQTGEDRHKLFFSQLSIRVVREDSW